MNYREKIVESGIRILHSGLTVETWGNISLRDPDTGLIYMTPSGMPYDTLAPEDVVVMDSGFRIVEGVRKPSIESGMHIRIMNERSDVNAIIHTHPVDSQIFACLHRDIPPVIDEAAQILEGTVRCAHYALPGSDELAENVVSALGKGAACLMANHGAVCVGGDIDRAFRVCTVLEMTARIYYKALCIGDPKPIDDDKVAYMVDFVRNRYGQR
ncbi:MAG: class II aldolase/adducin family protein [Lachnospiraceae bacterium]|nr:class II aldolase/adducin family protein [Lachnospiraceae bacterium]